MRIVGKLFAVLGLSATGLAIAASAGAQGLQTGTIPAPVILTPAAADVRSEVVLISDGDGWTPAMQRAAEALRDSGAIVIGIDLVAWTASIDARPEGCHYLVGDIESLGHQVQRDLGNPELQFPVVAGVGAGGTLALSIAAQIPVSTVAGTVAIDPSDAIALGAPLCTGAARQQEAGGTVYMLPEGPLPDAIDVWFTPAAPAAGRAHVADLAAKWPQVAVHSAPDVAQALLAALGGGSVDGPPANPATGPAAVDTNSATGPAAEQLSRLADLPLSILPATPERGVMAVIYSGDGGWRDLDRRIGQDLAARGVPTVGIDSLSYFWTRRTPEETAVDLTAILDAYSAKWGTRSVILAGYSFGADILPSTYLALDAAHRAMIRQVSLLGLGRTANYEVSVAGWLGASGDGPATLDDLRRMDLSQIQCFYGADEADSACPDLQGSDAQLVRTAGGHHFDGNYDALADRILAGPQTPLAADGGAAKP